MQTNPHTVRSIDHPEPRIEGDACRACQGTGSIIKERDCPRCEGTGRDLFYGVYRPEYLRGKRKG